MPGRLDAEYDLTMAIRKTFLWMVAVLLYLVATTAAAAVDSESINNDHFKWHLVSAQNFSSQIRLYPHILLLVTVPWCGESRSLMKGISQKLVMEQQNYNSLKLMLIHRNLDKLLANSLDSAEGITILYYQHAVFYKYKGSLRVQEILSSISYVVSLAPEDFPFKRLKNANDLEKFISSTDKAVLLFETCGWASRLLAKQNGNATVQGEVIPRGLKKEENKALTPQIQKSLKDTGNEIDCVAESGCGQTLWVGEFSAENGTTKATEDVLSMFEDPCSFEAYNKFESFFLKFLAMARAQYLPPQKQRYGVVSERSLLSTFGVEVSDQWALIISYSGCLDCLRIIKEENHLGTLEMVDLPVIELEDRRNDVKPAFPIDRPSILLFMDRTSDSIETRRTSHEAYHAFKEVAEQHMKLYQVCGLNVDWPKQSSQNNYQASGNVFRNQRLLLSTPSQKIKLKDKMSIMIINEGEQVALNNDALNLHSGSLHEILTYLVGKRKHSKLSSLVKEAGFHLLSDDLDVKVADASSSQTENQHQQSDEGSVEISDNGVIDITQGDVDSTFVQQKEQSESVNVEAASDHNKLNASSDVMNKDSASVDPQQSFNAHEIDSSGEGTEVQGDAVINDTEGLKHHFSGFAGSFYFSDGNYELLRSLTNDSVVPRIVIIDPITQQHFVFHEMTNFSTSSVSSFLESFIDGALTPYQRSGALWHQVDMPRPPFVNLNFQEKDSIPCVTTETFSEVVHGSGQFDALNATDAWNKDVLVLFSTSWCGFCQRMELVLREVYRALEGYLKLVQYETANKEELSEDDINNALMKPLPAIYSIDCTLNECGLILKLAGKSEVYPTLLLFPARNKTAITYDGNMMVVDVIKFIASHGSTSHHLAWLKGVLWTDSEDRDPHDDNYRDAMTSASIMELADGNKDKKFKAHLNEVKLQNQVPLKQNEKVDQMNIVVGSFLEATKNMHGLSPFNEVRILMVDTDPQLGFQGLIVNRPISWTSLPRFEDIEVFKKALLSFGGPVIHEEMPLVSLTRSLLHDHNPQVLPGVFYLDQLATCTVIELVKEGNHSATDYWFFWGYSGWGWDQLFSEIAAGVWSIHDGKDLLWA